MVRHHGEFGEHHALKQEAGTSWSIFRELAAFSPVVGNAY
jgi:hypothetical protein